MSEAIAGIENGKGRTGSRPMRQRIIRPIPRAIDSQIDPLLVTLLNGDSRKLNRPSHPAGHLLRER